MGWSVLYLRPRAEKKMAEHSQILGMDFYLPLRVETKIYQRRKVTVNKPIFPGYFFVSLTDEGRTSLLRTNHVLRIIKPLREEELIHQLDQIKSALAIDQTLGKCHALKKGRRVRIVAGPFMGIEGVIWSLKGDTNVRLNIDMIGQATSVDVDKDYLELLD